MSIKFKSSGINFNVATVEELPTVDLEDGLVCVVTDEGRGGTFIYRSENALVNNGGTIFNGWCRQYSGAVNVKWFGAKVDGTTSSSNALNLAYNSLPSTGGQIYFSKGKYLLDQTHIFSKPVLIIGEGCSSTPGSDASSQIIKASSVNGPLITVSGLCSGFIDIGFEGQDGNIGNGLQINCGRSLIRNVSSHRMGQDGVRIGDPTISVNANLMTVDGLYCRYNGRDGLHISDTDGTMAISGPNANGGTIQKVETAYNGRDGIHIYNSWYLTVIGDVPQFNLGIGLHIINDGSPSYNGSRYHTILGGEQNESNVGGNIVTSSYQTTYLGIQAGSSFVNTGVLSSVFGSVYSSIINATFDKCDTYPIVYKGYSGTTFYPIIVRNQSNPSTGRGVGIEFQSPDGTNSYRTGGRIKVEQSTTNKDTMTLMVNSLGTQTTFLELNPNGNSVAPGIDNTISIGRSDRRWSVVYAGSGTINTSDDREKRYIDITDIEKKVAIELKLNMKKFKFNDAIEAKGEDKARIHFGASAQTVKSIFEKYGLNASDYAILCHDEWEEQEEIRDEEENIIQEFKPSGDRYGIRYEELLCFIMSAL